MPSLRDQAAVLVAVKMHVICASASHADGGSVCHSRSDFLFKANPSVNLVLKSPGRIVPMGGNDEVKSMDISLDADFRSVFHWNVKQVGPTRHRQVSSGCLQLPRTSPAAVRLCCARVRDPPQWAWAADNVGPHHPEPLRGPHQDEAGQARVQASGRNVSSGRDGHFNQPTLPPWPAGCWTRGVTSRGASST